VELLVDVGGAALDDLAAGAAQKARQRQLHQVVGGEEHALAAQQLGVVADPLPGPRFALAQVHPRAEHCRQVFPEGPCAVGAEWEQRG
jgi:hypothetical protein